LPLGLVPRLERRDVQRLCRHLLAGALHLLVGAGDRGIPPGRALPGGLRAAGLQQRYTEREQEDGTHRAESDTELSSNRPFTDPHGALRGDAWPTGGQAGASVIGTEQRRPYGFLRTIRTGRRIYAPERHEGQASSARSSTTWVRPVPSGCTVQMSSVRQPGLQGAEKAMVEPSGDQAR